MSKQYQGATKELCSGVLYKCGPKFKYWNKRFFILKDDHCLYYYKDTAKGHLGVITLRDPKFSVREGEVSDASWPKSVSMDKAFVVLTNQRRYCMYSTSEEEVRMWVRVLGGARERLIEESSLGRRSVSTSGVTTSPSQSPSKNTDKGRPHSEAALDVPSGIQRQATYEEMGSSDHLIDGEDAIYDMAKAEENSVSSRSGSGSSCPPPPGPQSGDVLYEEVGPENNSITSQPLPPLPPAQPAPDMLYEDIGDQQQPLYECVVPNSAAHEESPPPLPRKDSDLGPPLPPRLDSDAPPLPDRNNNSPPSPVKRSPPLPRKQSPPLPPKESPPVQHKPHPPLPPKATPESSPRVAVRERPSTPPPRGPSPAQSPQLAPRSPQNSPLLARSQQNSPQLARSPVRRSPTLPPKDDDCDEIYEVPPTEYELAEAGIKLSPQLARSPQNSPLLTRRSPSPVRRSPPKDDDCDEIYEVPPTEFELAEAGIKLSPQLARSPQNSPLLTRRSPSPVRRSPILPPKDEIYEVPPTEDELAEAGIKLSDLDTDGSPPLKHKSPQKTPESSPQTTPPLARPNTPQANERRSPKPSPQPRRKLSETQSPPKPAPRNNEGSDRGHDLFRSRQARLEDLVNVDSKRRAQTMQLLTSDEVGDKVSFANTLREVEQEKLAASEEKFRWERERMRFEEERKQFEEEKRQLQEQLDAAKKQLGQE